MLDFSNIAEGLRITILGMGVVFAVLIIIMAVIIISSKIIMTVENRKNKPKETVQPVLKSEPIPVPVPVQAAPTENTELIAVITAAIAMQENKSVDELVVRNIRRVNNWNKENFVDNLF